MSFHYLLPSLLLSSAAYVAAEGTPIPIDTYTDNSCLTPSTTAANVTVEIGVCAVTPGLGSFALNNYPCQSGIVKAYGFSDTSCGTINPSVIESFDSTCWIVDGQQGDIAAIMLSCNPDGPGTPTSTTTITVGAVATGGSASTSAVSGGSSSTSTSSSEFGQPTDATSATSTSNSSNNSWNTLDYGSRTGIIVALAVGVPPIIIGLLAIYLHRRRRMGRLDASDDGTPLRAYGNRHPYLTPGPSVDQWQPRGSQQWSAHSQHPPGSRNITGIQRLVLGLL